MGRKKFYSAQLKAHLQSRRCQYSGKWKPTESEKKRAEAKAKQLMGTTVEEIDHQGSPLFRTTWHRIVLDEAHMIKDKSSLTAKAVFNLEATFRWALTGTPIMNKVEELYSLLRFIKFDPFAYTTCNTPGCNCHGHWDELFPFGAAKCTSCECTSFKHDSFWRKNIEGPIKRYGMRYTGKNAM